MLSANCTKAAVTLTLACVGVVPALGVPVEQDLSKVARKYLEQHQREFGLSASDLRGAVVSSVVPSRNNGVTHVYLEQRHRGIAVLNGIANVNLRPDGSVLSAGSRFVPGLVAAARAQAVSKTAVEAAAAAADHLKMKASRPFEVLGRQAVPDQAVTLSDGGIATRPIEARLMWVPVGDGVRLAWRLEIDAVDGEHWWHTFVDAQTGESLGRYDLIVHDSAEATAAAIARPRVGRQARAGEAPAFPITDGALYNVFPLPFESASDGPRSLVSGAADPAASPFGWHDTNGVAGPEFTVTRGNNVHAYTDIDANNVADPGSDPDGGPGLVFDFPLDLGQNPPSYRPAAVTNLFYWNNIMHDVAYGYGFDEAAGNFQVNNYGHPGLGSDDVRAEAQDGSGTNNANFGTPVDGFRPRMQMFVWTHPFPNFVTVNTPLVIAGDYTASGAVFGPTVAAAGPITREVAYVGRGCDPAYQAGQPLDPYLASPAGKIALIDRGSCTFVAKVKKAQDQGALAVIAANNVAGDPITMGGADATITIPSSMVSLDNGNLYKANAPVNATLRANPLTSVNRDSDLDAGVISHEYGHGISNRLTGGPATVSCLNNAEQMGEGWSDWFALTLTTDPADRPTTPRGVGTYVTYQPSDGVGIRPTQYTTDMSVNPSTYAWVADTANISQPHGIGYVWNTMLWEVYWNLVDRYGYNADPYGAWSTGGNNLASQLVMDGMKFQVCRPGFVDGRNAILQADTALTGGANQCEIWRGFTKRGLGASASQGLSSSRTDGVEAFDLPANCTAATFGGFRPPVDNAPAVNSVNAGSTVPLKFSVTGVGSVLIDSQDVDCTTLVPTGSAPAAVASPALPKKGNEYHVNWKTDPSWAGTCRRLTLRVPAATDPVAYFNFF